MASSARGPPSPQQVTSTQREGLHAEHRKHEDFGNESAMTAGGPPNRVCLPRAADSEVRAPGAFSSEEPSGFMGGAKKIESVP